MKRLFGIGIFILVFMLSVGLSFAIGYDSDVNPSVFHTWQQVVPIMGVEHSIGTTSLANRTGLNTKYVGVDVYIMYTQRGGKLLAYILHTMDGELLYYELDVLSNVYVSVERLDEGFIERLDNRIAVRNKLMQESTQ